MLEKRERDWRGLEREKRGKDRRRIGEKMGERWVKDG